MLLRCEFDWFPLAVAYGLGSQTVQVTTRPSLLMDLWLLRHCLFRSSLSLGTSEVKGGSLCWRKDPAWTLLMIRSFLVIYRSCLRPCFAISLMTLCVIYWCLSPVCYSSLGEASGSWAFYHLFYLIRDIHLFYVYIPFSCDLHPDILLYGIYIQTLLYGYRRDTFPPLNRWCSA